MENNNSFIQPNINGFKGAILDNYLANGYYRMQQNVFTVNCLFNSQVEHNLTPVFWLRINNNLLSKEHKTLSLRKKCKQFIICYKEAHITDEVSNLYKAYKDEINFEHSESCESYLYKEGIENPFVSMMIEIRDCSRLIAVGYFDKGQQSIAGILNFYHPDYKKYSLGKYLILKKIDYAIEHQIPFYYTGYIGLNYSKFDYKLYPEINAIEVFLPIEKEWVLYKNIQKEGLANYFNKNVLDLLKINL